jgi:hypothetical protein
LKEGIAGGDSAVRSSIPAKEGNMFSKRIGLCLLIVVLAALGLAPVAQAGARSSGRATARTARAHAAQPGFLQIVWRGVSQIFEKEGNSIDPHGTPNSNPGTSGTNDEGSGIDPSGVTHG